MSRSGSSSGSSKMRRGRGNCVGIPRKCSLCDAGINIFMSRSESNPNRKFFRCTSATNFKLCDDNHIFKWVDEAVDEEVVVLSPLVERLEKEVCEVRMDFLQLQREFDEHKKAMKLGCVAVVCGCVIMAVLLKFI